MALTLIKSPGYDIALAKNQINWFLDTNGNQFSTAGNPAGIQIILSAPASDGDTFTLSFNNIELDFVCATMPDDSGLQFRPLLTAELQAGGLENLFNNNYYITTFFYVSRSSTSVIITSKEKGTLYQITESNKTGTPASWTYNYTSGVNPVLRENYNVYLRILIDDVIIGEDVLYPDLDDLCKFEISEYLAAKLSILQPKGSFFTWPETTDAFFEHDNFVENYDIKYWEVYGEPPIPYAITTIKYNKTVNFGLETSHFGVLNQNDDGYNYFAWGNLLSNSFKKITSSEIIERLYYFTPNSGTNLKLFVEFYDINKNSSGIIEIDTITTEENTIFELVTSFDYLWSKAAYFGFDQSDVIYYKYGINITLSFTSSLYFVYNIDRNPKEYYKQILYRNSRNTYSTLILRGKYTNENEYVKESFEKTLPPYYSLSDTGIETTKTTEISTITTNTGWFKRSDFNKQALRELMNSDDIKEVKKLTGYYENGETIFVPINIVSSKIIVNKVDENLISIDIEYQYPINTNISDINENIPV